MRIGGATWSLAAGLALVAGRQAWAGPIASSSSSSNSQEAGAKLDVLTSVGGHLSVDLTVAPGDVSGREEARDVRSDIYYKPDPRLSDRVDQNSDKGRTPLSYAHTNIHTQPGVVAPPAALFYGGELARAPPLLRAYPGDTIQVRVRSELPSHVKVGSVDLPMGLWVMMAS